MPINSTERDRQIEDIVWKYVKPIYPAFHGEGWTHKDTNPMSGFDYEKYVDGKLVAKADVRCAEGIDIKYPTNLMTGHKYTDYMANKDTADFYVIYYYKKACVLKIYNLKDTNLTYIPDYKVWHKREERWRYDPACRLQSDSKTVCNNVPDIKTAVEKGKVDYAFGMFS